MRVGMVVHAYDKGDGTGGYVVELVQRIADKHEVTVYTSSVRAPVPTGVKVVKVPAVRAKAYLTILSFPLAFAAVRGRHDVVHAQGWVTGTADVVTSHIVLAAWRASARAAGIHRSALGERFFGGFVTMRERALYRDAAAVIAPSQKVARELADCYNRHGAVDVIPHGFPAPEEPTATEQARDRFGVPRNAFLALYVGDARKGLRTAIDAVAATECHLLVLSASPREEFLGLASRAGLESRLHWAGYVPDPASAYAAADLLLHPTIYDAFGMVVAESMSCGVPPIVSRAAGVAELIAHGQSGWIVDGDDLLAGSVAGLRAIEGDRALRERLAEGARATAARRSWDQVARETLGVYERFAPA